MTGVPHAIASIMTRPNGSGQSIGTNSPIAPLRKSDFSASPISPIYSTRRVTLDQRANDFIVIFLIGPIDLRGDPERYAASRPLS